MTISRTHSPNHSPRNGNRPDMLVCHITEGSFGGTVDWISNASSQVSYHFVVARDGRITQAVPIEQMAWANGTSVTAGDRRHNQNSTLAVVRERGINANLYTISIGFEGIHRETNGRLEQAQLDAGVWLIRHIQNEVRRLFNITIPSARTHIVGHFEVTPLTRPNCPGSEFPFDEIIRRLHASNAGNMQNTDWVWPVPGFPRVSSGFGPRDGQNHNGIDIGRNLSPPREILGAEIVAAADGRVITSSQNHRSWGNFIVIDHGSGIQTTYAHNLRNIVSVGDNVRQGQVIGHVGNSGDSTAPHLHFEKRINGVAVDPMRFFNQPGQAQTTTPQSTAQTAPAASAAPPGTNTNFRILVGEFATREGADALRDEIRQMPGYEEAWTVQEGNAWRVQVGSGPNRDGAERTVDSFRAQGFEAMVR